MKILLLLGEKGTFEGASTFITAREGWWTSSLLAGNLVYSPQDRTRVFMVLRDLEDGQPEHISWVHQNCLVSTLKLSAYMTIRIGRCQSASGNGSFISYFDSGGEKSGKGVPVGPRWASILVGCCCCLTQVGLELGILTPQPPKFCVLHHAWFVIGWYCSS